MHGCGRARQARVSVESWLARPPVQQSQRLHAHLCQLYWAPPCVQSPPVCCRVRGSRCECGACSRHARAAGRAHLGPRALGAPVRVATARVQSGEPQRHGYRCMNGGATHPLAPGGCATCSRATTRRSRNHALPQNARQLPSTRHVSPAQPAHKTRHPGVGKRAAAVRRAVTSACRKVDGVVPLRPVWPRLGHAPVSVHLGQTHG